VTDWFAAVVRCQTGTAPASGFLRLGLPRPRTVTDWAAAVVRCPTGPAPASDCDRLCRGRGALPDWAVVVRAVRLGTPRPRAFFAWDRPGLGQCPTSPPRLVDARGWPRRAL